MGVSAIAGLPGCTYSLDLFASHHSLEQGFNQLQVKEVREIATRITVKILSTGALGSGFLIKKQGQVYTVLTNEHVLRVENASYRIQTPDGRIHEASLLNNISFQGNDLALLEFTSPIDYRVASINQSLTLPEGQEVFAAGFPLDLDDSAQAKFEFTSGKISLVLDKALEGGYQVGYTNEIEKGMSGGPLLNHRGEVVGVNGKHAYPLWDVPSVFQDGSQAEPTLHEKINRLSWAVPIETALFLSLSVTR